MNAFISLALVACFFFSACKSTSPSGEKYPCPVYEEDLQNITGITETDGNGNLIGNIDSGDWYFFTTKYLLSFSSKPVVLSLFEIYFANEQIHLHWITQSESNNAQWNIYRSLTSDIQQSEKINPSPIEGGGTISEPREYYFLDEMGYEFGTTYYYWLESIDFSNVHHLIEEPVEFTVPSDIFFTVGPAYPNPSSAEVKIPYSLATEAKVTIIIIDADGNLIDTLISETKPKGEYELIWYPDTNESGIYRCIYHVSQTYHWHGDILVQ
jgi:hypothetical protein